MKKKINSKNIMLPHSKAKVRFYKSYLDLYLRVLCNAEMIDTINIYDVFCGMGIYDDGGKGSPIEAHEVIIEIVEQFNPVNKNINLFINDKSYKRVSSVMNYIHQNGGCNGSYTPICSSMDGEIFLDQLSRSLRSTPSDTRNLIFIDPYGYKEVKKDVIERLMSNGKTEVMIFLPISFMNRFTNHAMAHKEVAMFEPLRKFVDSFFSDNHPIIRGEQLNHLQYIEYVTEALRFNNNYYSTSYHIERSPNNYFALFFLTSNIYGYEKILETKWKLDEKDGNGFELPRQPGLFDDFDAEESKKIIFDKLYQLTMSFLNEKSRTNSELYYFALNKEYLPKHMTKVLKFMSDNNIIEITPILGALPYKSGAYYINKEGSRILIGLKR